MASQKPLSLIAIAVLTVVTSAVYARALNSPFVFDDSGSVSDNRSIVRLWPLIGDLEQPGPLNPAKDLPTSGRPLVNLSLALNYQIGRLNPVGYHVFNLIVHVMSALLLMAIVRRTLCLDYFGGTFEQASGWLAFIAALLWVLHPLQTETVVYVTQRTELLVGFFYLATLYASLRYRTANAPAGRKIWLTLATLACICGMACKEVMVTAPVIVLLFDRTFVAGSFRQTIQKSWPLYVGLFLSWGLLFYLNHTAPRSESAGFDLGIPAYAWWFTQAKILLLYLKLAVWPWPLAIHYEMPYLTTFGTAWPWILTVAILAAATLFLFRRRNAVGFVGVWMLLILSPTLVVPIVTEVAAERRMYLPLAALVTLFVAGGYWLVQQCARRLSSPSANRRQSSSQWPDAMTGVIALVLTVALGALSFDRLAAYHDGLTLWQDNVDKQPDNPLAHNNLGNALLKINRTHDAIAHYEQALRLKPNYSDAYINLATALSAEGRLQEAIDNFQRLLEIKSDYPTAQCNLGVALSKSGRVPEAIVHFQEALRLKPDYFDAHYNFGNALADLGRTPEAIEQYRQALQLDPKDAPAQYNLANALRQAQQNDEAIEHFQMAVQIRPDFAEAHNNLGATLLEAGRVQEAIEHYQQSVQLRPDHAKAYVNLAIAYARMNRSNEAIAAAEKGLAVARSQGQTALAQQIETWLSAFRTN